MSVKAVKHVFVLKCDSIPVPLKAASASALMNMARSFLEAGETVVVERQEVEK